MTSFKIWRMYQFNKCFAHLHCLGKALASTCWENSCSFLCFLRLVSCDFLSFQRKHYFQFLFFLSLSVPFSLGKVFGKALARTCWEDSSQYWERADQQSDKTFVGYFLHFLRLISSVFFAIMAHPFFCIAHCGSFKFLLVQSKTKFSFLSIPL